MSILERGVMKSTTSPTEPPPPESQPRRTGQQRLGGRSERVVRDVIRATVTELARVGYGGLRVEDVAAQAGVNKTTVYRRWPTKADLVDATLRELKGPVLDVPDQGSVRLELLWLLRTAVANASTCEGKTIHRVMTLEMDHPEVASIARALRAEYAATWTEVIVRAIARGELPERTDPRLVVEVAMGSVFSILRRGDPVDDDFLAAIVNLVVIGAKGGGAVRGTAPARRDASLVGVGHERLQSGAKHGGRA